MADNENKRTDDANTTPDGSSASAAPPAGKFTQGNTLRHVVVMTMTGSVGLMSTFLVDFANLFYISQLGQAQLAAAIGYSGTLLFFLIAISIGLTIAGTALVSRAIGAGDRVRARRLGTAALLLSITVMTALSILTMVFVRDALGLLGASGETLDVAIGYLLIVLPATPFMGIGMVCSGLLRAVGDARRSMYVMLLGGAVSAVMDPLLIFGLDLGVNGAAISTVMARTVVMGTGLYGAILVHDLIARPNLGIVKEHAGELFKIAGPAMMTNLATPVGNAFVTSALAVYGDAVVAGWAVIGRIIPVAFGAVFALSGAVGPILGQNFGAGLTDRVRSAYLNACGFIVAYGLVVWLVLWAISGQIVIMFDASGEGADLIIFFCKVASLGFIFNGALFVANASFNTLGVPLMSTGFNWARATIGIVPFVWIGASLYGANGVLAGHALGGVAFGLAAAVTGYRVIGVLSERPTGQPALPVWQVAMSAFSSGRAWN